MMESFIQTAAAVASVIVPATWVISAKIAKLEALIPHIMKRLDKLEKE